MTRIREIHARVGAPKPSTPASRTRPASRQGKDAESFRLLVEAVKDYAIYMLDAHGVVTTWNAGAEKIKGYDATEIIGQHFSRFYPSEDVLAGKCERALRTAIHDGRFEDEGWRVRKDGTRFWASAVITALHSPAGEVIGFAKVTRDLTEKRKADEARIELAQAQEANRVKDEFLATVSHELRTPLTSIFGWSSILKDKTDLSLIAKGLETIRRNAQVQIKLIDDMLDVSRIVSGKLRVEKQPMDLALVVHDALEVVRPAAKAKNVTLAVEGCDEPLRLDGDPARLQQVVWNLLSNAVKFTDGGVVTLSAHRSAAGIALHVSDTGRGIAPDFLPHVFERFRQADNTTTRRVSGLGLGLAIAKHIIELHDGAITVASDGLGEGATFTVTLPNVHHVDDP